MKNVLFIGPNYKKRKGGIASVLEQYSLFLGSGFKFLPTAYFQTAWKSTLILPFLWIRFGLRLILDRSIEIVHIHGSSRGSFSRQYPFFLIAKQLFGKTIVYHVHSGAYDTFYSNASAFKQRQIKYMVENSDVIASLSKEWKYYFSSNFKAREVIIINNIVPFNLEPKISVIEPLKILFLGKLGRNKGIFDLLECLRLNKSKFENKVELYVGGNGEVEKFKGLIDEYSLQKMVHYLGWVDGSKKEQLLQDSDIMILPSYSEGLPISLLEAMSFAMPLISTHVGGISNILFHNQNGQVIEPGNIEDLTKSINLYINQPELVAKHGQTSYRMVTPFFPEQVFKRLSDLYTSLKG